MDAPEEASFWNENLDDNGERIWRAVASRIVDLGFWEPKRAYSPHGRKGDLFEVWRFSSREELQPFEATAPLNSKQKWLIGVAQRTEWETFDPEDLGYGFSFLRWKNFRLEKAKL